jgi:hypothetical protein
MVVTTRSGIKCQRLDRVSNVALLGEQWLYYLDKIDKCAEFTVTVFNEMKKNIPTRDRYRHGIN